MTENELFEIEEEIECIQTGYDLVGYLSTNTADELINYARQLIATVKKTIDDKKNTLGINHFYGHENKPPYMDLDDE
jgi:hypothetical protein